MRVLLYAPDEEMIEPIARVFSQCSFHTDTCTTTDRLHYLSASEHYAAVIVRSSLSLEMLSELYNDWKKNNTKSLFIVVTPNQSFLQRAKALEIGIDRYYIEPHSYTQIIADILQYEYSVATPEYPVQTTAYFEVDLIRRSVKAMGTFLELTKTEFDILAMFLRKRGLVLSRPQIWEEIWGYEEYPMANTVDVHINRLRKKLPSEVRPLLSTVYGVGYRMLSDA